MKKSHTYSLLKARENIITRLFFEGLAVGLIAGLIAVIYRLMLSKSEEFFFTAIEFVKGNALYILLWFVFLIVIGFIISRFLKYEPYISGSGIPQVEAEVLGYIDECWYKVLVSKMIAGTLCVLGGLSLGREGPSIQLGAMVGKGVSKFFKRLKTEERFLMTCGGAAGLAAAFNAPLAGIIFALEEIHKNFSTTSLVSVMCASLTGDFVSRQIFGLSPTLHFTIQETVALNQYMWLIILGIVTGILAVFYNRLTMVVLKVYDSIKCMPSYLKVLIPLMVSGVAAFFIPEIMGGGHVLINALNQNDYMISMLIFLLITKFLFSLLCFGSGAPGGIFFPMLVLGSLIGAIFGKFALMFGVPEIYYHNFMIVAMAGFFAGIVKAPITGIVLIAEMCGTLQVLLPIAIVAFVSYMTSHMLSCEPIYESLLQRLVKDKKTFDYASQKELLTFTVDLGSYAVNQTVHSVELPPRCLIVSLVRGQTEMIPHGDTQFYVGDEVVVIVDKYHIDESVEMLNHLFTYKKMK